MHAHKDSATSTSGLVAFAINNPYFIIVVCLLVAILGSLSLVLMPKDLLPAANLPAVQILAFYPGMPVEDVEKNLTYPFELYTGQAIGIERQESKSLVGVGIVKNFFNNQTDLNTAIAQMTSLVMSVLRQLPPGAQPPLILPFDPMAAMPLALVAVGGDKKPAELYDMARYNVRNAIQSVPGAMAPTVMGGSQREVIVYLDPKKMDHFNFTPLDVMEKLSHLNTFIPAGDVKIDDFDYQITSNGLVEHISDMNYFPLRGQFGVPVYISDIGKAEDAGQIQTNVVLVDGKEQVYVPVYRQPGGNSLQVVDDVKASIKKLGERFHEIRLAVVADQSVFIRHAIHSITEEALLGGGLAALMVLLFLGNPRATFAIVLSLPLSLLAAFIGLNVTGQTINAMTLGGFALSIGVLVDNSIVVLENIGKKLEAGITPLQAALTGASEVAMPVLASTLATLVVFFPVIFLNGIVKILFAALAKAVMFVMIGSFLAAMTVMPLFASRCLVATSSANLFFIFVLMQNFMRGLTNLYGKALTCALAYRKSILLGVLGLILVGVFLVPAIGTELFPRVDAGNFTLELRLATGTRIEKTREFAKTIDQKLRQWIEPHDLRMIIVNAGVYYGFPAAFTPNSGPQDVFLNIELSEDRNHSTQYYAKIIRERIHQEFPNVEMGVELGGLLTSALNGGLKAPIDIQIEGPAMMQSNEIAKGLVQKIQKLKGAVDVRIQQRFDAPTIRIDVDRKKAQDLSLTTDSVIKNVVSAVSGSASFNPQIWVDPNTGYEYFFGVQYRETSVTSLADINNIPIKGVERERTVPLKWIAKVKQTTSPSEVNHVNLLRVIDIYLDAQNRDVGSLSSEIQKIINQSALPTGYTANIRGEISEMNHAVNSLGGGFLLAAILVYLILVVQFRSFMLPLIIMATVPMGVVGIIIMLVATHTYFSIQAAIGAIFMIGIAVANGVLLIEFISHHAKESSNLDFGIVTGAKARLRPILMTSLASMLGLVPMAIGLGHGSEANIPLGRAVIGGQLLSTFLTLFIVPILYHFLMRNSKQIVANT